LGFVASLTIVRVRDSRPTVSYPKLPVSRPGVCPQLRLADEH
jgi:hypothetical protein